MSRLLERTWLLISLVGLTLAGLAPHQAGRLDPLQRTTGDVFAPAQRLLTSMAVRVNNVIDTARRLEALQAENAELRDEVARLTLENVRLAEAAAENARLREGLGFKQANQTFQLKGADVVARGGPGL